jgi:hypothetical protein
LKEKGWNGWSVMRMHQARVTNKNFRTQKKSGKAQSKMTRRQKE